jgi:hypothetical protein
MPLTAWANFYAIVGASAASLTGLMFVVVTLIPDAGSGRTGESVSAFGTPTVVHFCAALLVSVIMCAPWPAAPDASLAVGLTGALGLGYVAVVLRRARRQSEYQPVFEDWLWHTLLPFAGYAALVIASFVLTRRPGALFIFGASTVLLLFIGIHNAWDTVTYLALARMQRTARLSDGAPVRPEAAGAEDGATASSEDGATDR